jgi:hypothetical protein
MYEHDTLLSMTELANASGEELELAGYGASGLADGPAAWMDDAERAQHECDYAEWEADVARNDADAARKALASFFDGDDGDDDPDPKTPTPQGAALGAGGMGRMTDAQLIAVIEDENTPTETLAAVADEIERRVQALQAA